MKPFTLIQLTDPHVFDPRSLRPRFLFDKRLLGGVNALLNRRRRHGWEVTEAALRTVARLAPDHLLVTGDLTTLAALPELQRFREALAQLPLHSRDITVLPGNHDAYVPGAVRDRRFGRVFEEFLRSDAPFAVWGQPVVRIRGQVAVIGLDTARPSPPLLAVGTVGRAQLARLEAVLADPRVRSCFRLIGVHHPPQPGVGHWHNRLTDAAQLRGVLARQGAELVLHGHLHRDLVASLGGAQGPVPVRGTGSVSSREALPGRTAQFRRVIILSTRDFEEEVWSYDPSGRAFTCQSSQNCSTKW